MTATNLTSEESLQQLLAGEIDVSDLPDAVALKLIALIRLVHDNLEDGLKEIPLPAPAADDASAAKTYLKNIADALATQPATQQAEAQHISGETHREAAEQRHGFKKFLGALVEFATPENRARVRTRLERALTPFHFDDTKAAALVEQLAKYPYFYTSDDGSPIFDFHTKITGIVTRIAQRLGWKEGSEDETKLLDDYVKAAMKQPQLFCQDPDTIFCNLIGTGTVNGKSRTGIVTQIAGRLGLKEGSKKETKLLDDYVQAAMKQPQLFYQDPDTIFCNLIGTGTVNGKSRTGIVTRIAERRGFKKGSIEETKLLDDYVQAAMKQPQLFCQDPDTIFCNLIGTGTVNGKSRTGIVTRIAERLGFEKGSIEETKLLDDYVQAAMKQPSLFYQDPDTIFCNLIGTGTVNGKSRTGIVTRIAERLGFEKGSEDETKLLNDYVQAAMEQPPLFYLDPDTIFSKISTIMDYAARLHADGHIFPKPLPREQKAGLEGDRLLVRRLLNQPALLASASDALWLGFTHATVKYGGEIKAEIPMYAMVDTRGTIETRLVTLLGGKPGPTPKNHPDTMEGKWSKAQAKNFLLRALAHEEMFYKPKKGTPTTWVEKESDPTPPTTQR